MFLSLVGFRDCWEFGRDCGSDMRLWSKVVTSACLVFRTADTSSLSNMADVQWAYPELGYWIPAVSTVKQRLTHAT